MSQCKFFGVNKMKGGLGQSETIPPNTLFNRSHNNFKHLHSPNVGLILENRGKINHAHHHHTLRQFL